MVKSFFVRLTGILTIIVLWGVPNLQVSLLKPAALELPEDLQTLINQTASDLNFPLPLFPEEEAAEQSSSEDSEDLNSADFTQPRSTLRTGAKASGVKASQPSVLKAAPATPPALSPGVAAQKAPSLPLPLH
ncbi:MAG: hypothetical protein MH252_20270 [Thermosynechococcaceae cyanobacterium MS004]|nr:hypothetical protein [Thermosynechococcaceae cyanobacterium MS004]